MHCPEFTIANCGVYDSVVSPAGKRARMEETVSSYEFEFYDCDSPGGLMTDGVFYPARKGGFACTRPGQRQKMVLPYRCFFFNLRTQDPELCDLLDSLPNFTILWNSEQVLELFRQMLAIENRHSLESRLQLQSCVCRIVSLLSAYRQSPGTTDHNTFLHQKTLLAADKYIREHLSEDLSLGRLAAMYNLDPTYFHKLYTAAFGETPAKRTLRYRIGAAKTKLVTTHASTEVLAAECGFSSQTYFCYKFKQVTGQTPMQYRREVLNRDR